MPTKYTDIKDPAKQKAAKKAAKTRAKKAPENKPPEPKVTVEDTRTIAVTFTLEGIEAALIEAARQQAEADHPEGAAIPDDPIFQGIELDMSADRDGDDVRLNGATITFKFRP